MDSGYIRVVNVVATCNLNCDIDLNVLKEKVPYLEYNVKRFNGGILKMKFPKTTILLFRNGKVVTTGAKNSKIALRSVRKIVKHLQKLGIVCLISAFKIVNIVATSNIGKKIQLEKIYKPPIVIYEPELFPAAIYQENNSKLKGLIFSSGKIIITGFQEEIHIKPFFKRLLQSIKE
ncbi:TATA-box-binding protein-like protein [Dinothrombium tinctorium]|uniref:TATA-box-binding protein-like protein n=1 Tax=Dinothrombium tinctorium TaxID=1965070 RepID=A0A3S4QTA9_9ACAR|nr:TATA-box-binding protein-like protein [Dinothrombium tinctorium]